MNIAILNKKIEAIMKGTGENNFFSFGSLLFMVSLGYGNVVRLREIFYQNQILSVKRLPCIVISIGNLTVGGTGKTPMTIYVARLVKRLGYKVAILSRGYRGLSEKTGGIVSDGQTIFMGPDAAGDEPYMMASGLKNIPVIVGKNRYKAGMYAVKELKTEVLVLDDAFQHLKLKRDIDLVLLDNSHPFGNMHLFPRGILREPMSSLSRGDAFLFTRSDSSLDKVEKNALNKLKRYADKKPIYKTYHDPYIYKIVNGENILLKKKKGDSFSFNFKFLKGRKVFAFSGIAGNTDFRMTLENLKCEIRGFLEFADHHQYSTADFDGIFRLAKNTEADFLITTEKDYVRISSEIKWPIDLVVIGIEIAFGEDEDAFNSFIKSRLMEFIRERGGGTL